MAYKMLQLILLVTAIQLACSQDPDQCINSLELQIDNIMNEVWGPPGQEGCEASGFTFVESVNGCYKVANENLDWASAADKCRSLHPHAHVVTIGDQDEDAAVRQVLDSADTTGCYEDSSCGLFIWTAGQRIDPTTASDFVWRIPANVCYDEQVSDMAYYNWKPNQPDFYYQQESCVHICTYQEYKWNDLSCSSTMCSVCEVDI